MIELYTMPKCFGCDAVKRALDADHVPYHLTQLDQIDYGEGAAILADLAISGHFGTIEDLMSAPIVRNPATGDAIPASVLCSGDVVKLVTGIL